MEILGIDIGGSGIKGAPVDIETGILTDDRFRITTPKSSTPGAIAKIVHKIVRHFDWKGPIGCTFPSVIKNGVVLTAANMHGDWVDVNGAKMFQKETGCPVTLVNDADAAGFAEMHFGAGKGNQGSVIMITVGTGIGVAFFTQGILFPNAELGHIQLNGQDAENYASDRIRKQEKLGWKAWGRRVNEYLHYVEDLFWPDLFIIGGGVSKKHDRFFPEIDIRTPFVPAGLLNQAGIVGAAMAAATQASAIRDQAAQTGPGSENTLDIG